MKATHPFNELRRFSGHAGRFWPDFLQQIALLAGADAGVLYRGSFDLSAWKEFCCWTEHSAEKPAFIHDRSCLDEICARAWNQDGAWTLTPALTPGADTTALLALPLEELEAKTAAVIVLRVHQTNENRLAAILNVLKPLADTPFIYQRQRNAEKSLRRFSAIGDAFDLLLLLNAATRFSPAALTLVNELAARYRCSRVSLGWLSKGYVRLQAVSHLERFDSKMDIVSGLEAAMEETLDQDHELVWPNTNDSASVTRDHASFARQQGIQAMLSVPIRIADEAVAVLSCERQESPFNEDEIAALRILCDQAARRLADLQDRDRWIGARIASNLRSRAKSLLGPEHSLAKAFGLLVGGLLLFALIGRLPYRVDAPFILRSEDVRQVSVPFAGYIDQVQVRIGQQVKQGDSLLRLDTNDLLLQEAEAIANQIRFLREADKARARGSLIDMQIAQAQAEQAKAELDLIRYRLEQAQLRAPIDGIVVEGDLEELTGAPVKMGDILFKVARTENLFAELKINERDIHELSNGQQGELAFVSQPDTGFEFKVMDIEPIAQADEEGNVFLVRAGIDAPASWCRPGMSGLAKIRVGRRNVAWMLTHRTIDYLRLRLWW